MPDIKNVLIVQFGTRDPTWEAKAFGDPSNRNKWFAFRANLFNNGLHQCLLNQTKKPDKCYLFLADGDQDLYDKYLNKELITPIYCGDYNRLVFDDLYKNDILGSYVISRIDSDDLVCKDYFTNLNKQMVLYPKKFTVSCKGYRSNLVDIQSAFCSVAAFTHQFIDELKFESDFLSRLYYKNSLSTNKRLELYEFSHVDMWKIDHQQSHSTEWIQLVHGRNIHNEFVSPTTFDHDKRHTWESSYTPLMPIDPVWFKEWSGFELPNPDILQVEY